MAPPVDDRWLWLGLGLFLYGATKAITYRLQTTVALNEIHDPKFGKPEDEKRVEDEIPLSALKTLKDSPNQDIATAAVKVLLNRFLNSPENTERWAADFFANDPSVREQANNLGQLLNQMEKYAAHTRVLQFNSLISWSFRDDGPLGNTIRRVYHTITAAKDERALKSLQLFSYELEKVKKQSSMSWILLPDSDISVSQARDWAVKMRRRIQKVRRASYRESPPPPPPTSPPPPIPALQIRQRFEVRSAGDDADTVSDSGSGRSRRSVDSNASDTDSIDSRDEDEPDGPLPTPGTDAGMIGSEWLNPDRVARLHEESPEEAELRRRRREAMVLHEGSGSIVHEDIIHPRSMGA